MEKRWLMIFVAVFLLSTISAEIIFNQQPSESYSLGDSVSIPVTVKALSETSGTLYLTLICEGRLTNFYENGVDLQAGQEVDMSAVLSKDKIGFQTGECKIKAVLGDDYALTNNFKISDLIVVQSKIDQTEFNPGDTILFSGEAFKSNGEGANGFVKFTIVTENDSYSIEQMETVNNGYFSVSLVLPSALRAGAYLVKIDVYELNAGEVQTNKGFMNYNILIKQVPTSLEVYFEEDDIEPGSKLLVKAILHDQTGEKMDSDAILTIKRPTNEIVKQIELGTDDFFEFDVAYNEAPSTWSVFAVSNKLDSQRSFTIKEKKDVGVDIANGTVTFTNKGNIPYNDSVLLKLGGNSSLNVNINLAVDEVKKYEIRAPNGEYSVEVISDGQSKFSGMVVLTGRSVSLKEFKSFGLSSVNPFVWVFVVLVVGFGVLLMFKKGRRSLFRSLNFKKKHKPLRPVTVDSPMKNSLLIRTKNGARLSLSIKGEKQESGILCLRMKNLDSLNRKAIDETMQRIGGLAESKKAVIYENGDSIFFIFSPLKTKTFRNEKSAIELSQQIDEILSYHNKIFKDKFEYGISLDTGYLVSKINNGELEFVAMGNIIPNLKKIASFYGGGILLSKEFKDKAGAMVKTQDRMIDGMRVYAVTEMRDREQYSKFINAFLNNLERDKKKREEREKKG